MSQFVQSFRHEFEALCGQDAQQIALVDTKTGDSWSYSELLDGTVRFSSLLWDAGLRSGDRLFSLLPNSTEQILAFLAALLSGIDFCPISPNSTPEERRQYLAKYRPAAGLVPEEVSPGMDRELKRLTTKGLLISVPVGGDIRRYLGNVRPRAPDSMATTGRLLLFTSGTTSYPKAMVLNGDRLWSSARAWAGFHPILDSDSRFYNFLPMSYLGGLFNLGLIPLACHGSVVISEPFSGASILRFWPEVERTGVNTLWLPPTVLRTLLTLYKRRQEVSAPAAQVRVCFLGMAPVSMQEKENFEETFDIPVLENFALSETTFLTSEQPGSSVERSPGSVGRTLPWVDLRLRRYEEDPSKSEIEVKTPFLLEGYLNSDGGIDQPLTSDEYFATGDLGEFKQGVLVLKGRNKDIIKRGGYLVLLRDLEEVAQRHPSVQEVAAIGVPHDFYGESSVLCVRLANGISHPREPLTELTSLLKETLSRFKWPEQIIAMDSFPTTESGKVQKWAMSKWLDTGRGVVESIRFR